MKKTTTPVEQLPTIQRESTSLIEKVNAISITDQKTMTQATTLLSGLNRHLDNLTDEKELITKPLNEALKEVRSRYKPTELALEDAIAAIRKAMSSYQTAETNRQNAEAEKIAARVGSGKGHIKLETAVEKISAMSTVEKKTVTENGSVTFKPTPMFEVNDIGKLPVAYHLPNEIAIKQAMKEGTELPGVRYWIEQVPINRR